VFPDLCNRTRGADRIAAGKDEPSDLEHSGAAVELDYDLALARRPRLPASGDTADNIASLSDAVDRPSDHGVVSLAGG
jgi:hypothetical protein